MSSNLDKGLMLHMLMDAAMNGRFPNIDEFAKTPISTGTLTIYEKITPVEGEKLLEGTPDPAGKLLTVKKEMHITAKIPADAMAALLREKVAELIDTGEYDGHPFRVTVFEDGKQARQDIEEKCNCPTCTMKRKILAAMAQEGAQEGA